MKPALQTMVIAEALEKEGVDTAFRRIRDLGYQEIEISGHIDLSEKTLEEIIAACGKYNLHVCAMSCDYRGPFEDEAPLFRHHQIRLPQDFEEAVKTAEQLKCRYLRFAGLPVGSLKDKASVDRYFSYTEQLALRLKQKGIVLCAHNHVGEFSKVEGRTLFEWALQIAPDLQFEMDIYGVQMGGLNPLDYLSVAVGRVPLLHYSDIQILPRADPRFTLDMQRRVPLGEGNFNTQAILAKAQSAGTEYCIMECTGPEDPFGQMQKALVNFKNMIAENEMCQG